MPDPSLDERNVQEEQEKSQKKQAKPEEKFEPNRDIENSKGNMDEESSKDYNSEKCETTKLSQEDNEEVEQEFTANPEEFTSQEELLSYLQRY
ncbi:probable serine/threonine-protein kinase irlF [Melopsittacus undulatus]|uniref:probable serine/threonine-protein kinase irlF n=1 Tax=Melopsittacus undulatus TaxID=13146 RepID=UPI00146C0888|nr:probable serine/threonine-protein kinase irlF [Melopsittacus undulatus]